MTARARSLLHTVLVVLGALLVGQALHVSVVTGQASPAAPAVLGQFVVGLALIVGGYALGGRSPGADAAADGDDEEAFDPDLSPLGDAAPGGASDDSDARGDHDGRGDDRGFGDEREGGRRG